MHQHTVKLSEIAEINPKRPKVERDDKTLTSFIPMECVDDILGVVSQIKERPYSEIKKGYTYFETNDVIFAKITPCMQNGKHTVVPDLIDNLGFGSTEFHVIRPSNEVLPEWIHFFLRRSETLYAAEQTFTGAVGQQRVPKGFLESLDIPFVPLATQREIIQRLNFQLYEANKAREAAESQLIDIQALPSRILSKAYEL